jgi:SAM-dependent methyltransferase
LTEQPKIDLSPIAAIMEGRLAERGVRPEGLFWRDQKSMDSRFDQILTVCRHEKEPFGMSDLGCGYGGLFSRASQIGLPVHRYYGYDISLKMLEAARDNVKAPEREFIQADRLDRMNDYAFACGIFNMPTPGTSEAAWTTHVESLIRNLHEYTVRGFAFNSLTTYVDYRQDGLYYGDPLHFFDFCKREIGRKVTLLHDADSWEWTIYVRK